MNNNELIERLSILKLQEKNLLRILDRVYNDLDKRTRVFNQIKEIKKETENIKFKIRLEREMKKNENSNTN